MTRIVDMYTSKDVNPEEVFELILNENVSEEGRLEKIEEATVILGRMLRFFYTKLSDAEKVEFINIYSCRYATEDK